jgi:hypothetical protein
MPRTPKPDKPAKKGKTTRPAPVRVATPRPNPAVTPSHQQPSAPTNPAPQRWT